MGNDKQEEKPKKSFFQSLKSLAFENVEEESTEKSTQETSTSQVTSTPAFAYNYSATPGVVPNMSGVFDQKVYESFQKILEDNNIEGVDYLEFYKAKKSFEAMVGMAEPAKFQTAFLSLKALSPSLNKAHLTSTADIYLEKLAKEEAEFKAEMQVEIANGVTAKLNAAKDKEETIKSKQEQIAKINAEITELGMGISQDNAEAQMAQAQIDSTAKNFQATLDVVRNEINMNKEGIKNYIQE